MLAIIVGILVKISLSYCHEQVLVVIFVRVLMCRCGYMNVVAYISLWPLVFSSPYQSEE